MLGLLEDDPVKSIWDEVDQVLAAPPHSQAEHDAAERRLDQTSPPRPEELGPGNSGPRDIQLPSVWDDVDALLASPPAPVPTRTTVTSGQPGAAAAAASGAFSPLEQSVINRSAPVQMAETPTVVPRPPPAPPILEPHIGAAPPTPPPTVPAGAPPQLTPNPPVNAQGQLIPEAARGTVPVLDAPMIGIPQMARGATALAEPTGETPTPADTRVLRGRMTGLVGGKPAPMPAKTKAAISDVLEGGFKTLEPVMAAGLVTNPIGTGATVLTAMAASKGAEHAVAAAGGSDEEARLVGNVAAAVVGGAVGSEEVSRFARRQVGSLAADARAARAQADRAAPLPGEARGGEPQEPVPVGRGATPAAAGQVPPEAPPAARKPPPPVPERRAPPRTAEEIAYETMREKLARGEQLGSPELQNRAAAEQRVNAAVEQARAKIDQENAGDIWQEVDQVLAAPPGEPHAVQEQSTSAGSLRGLPGAGDEAESGPVGGRDAGGHQEPAGPRAGEEETAPPAAAGRDERVPEPPLAATMEEPRVTAETAGASPSEAAVGSVPPDRAAERPDVAGPGVQPPRVPRARAQPRRPAEARLEAEALNELVSTARAGGHTGDEVPLRAELADRLQLIKDLDRAFEDSGHNPETLLREIAQRGGLSVDAETGLKGELRWLREFQDRTGGTAEKPRFSFGQVRGVQNVFHEKGGTSVDDMLGLLRQDPRFAHLETTDDLLEEIRAAATAEHSGTAIDRLVKGLGDRWWERIGRAPDLEPHEQIVYHGTTEQAAARIERGGLTGGMFADTLEEARAAAERKANQAGGRAGAPVVFEVRARPDDLGEPIPIERVSGKSAGNYYNGRDLRIEPTRLRRVEAPVDVLDTGEAQARLPGAEPARQVGQADTTFRAPTQATGDDFAREFLAEGEGPIEVEPDLFNDEPGSSGLPRRPFRGAWERLPPEPGARKPPAPVPPKKANEPPPRDLLSAEEESGMPIQRFGKQELPQRPPPPVPPARRFFGKKRVMPVAEMVDALTKLFNGVPVSVGRFSRQNLGIYKHQPEAVRVQVAEDLHVIAHEMGHHLDLAIMGGSEAFRRGPIAKELKAVGAATSRPSYSAKQQRHEGAAEYFRRWLTEPEGVAQQAPLYTKAFEQYLERHPAIGTGLRAIRDEVQRYLQLPAVEQARLHVDFEGGGRGILRTAQELAAGAKSPESRARAIAYLSSQWMDDLAYLRLAEEDMADGRPVDIVRSAYVQARLARGAASKAEGFLQFGVRDDNGQFIGRSFDDAIAPIYDRLEDFAVYAAAKRAQGLHRRGKESGFTTTQITDTLERLRSPEFDTALEGLREFHRAKLAYMRQGGMLSADQVAKLVKIEPDYIPYQRVMDAVESALTGKKIANRGSPVKRMKGSGRRIVNPLETIVRNTHAEVTAVETNKAMQALVRLVRTTQGSGRWMEEIPEPQVATRFNLADLEKDIAGVLEEAGVELPEGGTTLDEILDTLVTVFTPQQFARGNTRVVTVLEDGKRAWFEVHDEGLYDAITAIGPRGAEEVVKLFFKGARVLRRTAVATLGFLIRNPIKDQLTATTFSRAGYRPGIEWLRGLFAYVGKREAYQLYLHSGGDQAMLVSTDRDVLRRRLRVLGHGPLRKLIDHTILGPLDGVEALAEAGERASRVGEFMRTLERTDARGRGALMQAGLNARDVTQDFQRAGRQARAWNQYTAFFSARLGGYGRMAEAFEENPARFMWKALSAIALPSLLLWILNHQDDEYNELPAWERNYYWHVPIKDVKTWRTTGFVRLPKPFELGQIFGSGTELALEWLFKKDPDLAGRLLDQRSAYQLVQSIIPTALLPWIEIAANYDFFRDRAIVDPARQELPAELQYNRWTSETAKALGRIFGVSPAKMETLVYGYTAGVGQGVLQGLDAVLGSKKPASGPGHWPVLGTVYRPLATSEAESLSEFYTARDALAALKAGVKDWRAMGDTARAQREIEKQRPWLADKAGRLTGADRQIAEFRTQVNAVFANPKLTPDQKRAALDDLYLVMIDIARQALGKRPIRRPQEFKPSAPVPPKH